MTTIWKFPFSTIDTFVLEMPKGANILSVQAQGQQPCIWAMVDDQEVKERRLFEVYGTGHQIIDTTEPTQKKFLGTYQLMNGALVFHLFETMPPF